MVLKLAVISVTVLQRVHISRVIQWRKVDTLSCWLIQVCTVQSDISGALNTLLIDRLMGHDFKEHNYFNTSLRLQWNIFHQHSELSVLLHRRHGRTNTSSSKLSPSSLSAKDVDHMWWLKTKNTVVSLNARPFVQNAQHSRSWPL